MTADPNLATWSLGALVVTIAASCTGRVNAGALGIVLAWLVGVYAGGLSLGEVFRGFPASLFLTLMGVLFLLCLAQSNGAMDRLARWIVARAPANRGLLPFLFFGFAWFLSTIGPGVIGAMALVFPMAMAAAGRAGIPAFLMTIMVVNGANAGNLAPFSPAGIVVDDYATRMGLEDRVLAIYLYNLFVHAVVAFGGYLLFGGWRLIGGGGDAHDEAPAEETGFTPAHRLTLAVIGAAFVAVVALGMDAGMAALVGACVLTIAGVSSETDALRRIPWSVVLMVCGVSTLVALLERTGGLDLFTGMLARVSTPATVPAVAAFATAVTSAYSSTSGVVLPAFLPTVGGLVEKLGGGDPVAIIASMAIGAQLSDVSPLSALGALCIASAAPHEDPGALFRKLLAWGMSMSIVGAFACFVLFSLF